MATAQHILELEWVLRRARTGVADLPAARQLRHGVVHVEPDGPRRLEPLGKSPTNGGQASAGRR
jgi:hypothetical protein